MKQCVVVVPVYTGIIRTAEKAAFKQMLSVLSKHDIVLVTYEECDVSVYKEMASVIGKDFTLEFFDSRYFDSVASYNDMCFSYEFYDRFSEYQYMLICQLDAWVFTDQLDYWCKKGYDYIGAPIFHAYTKKHYTKKILGIGNGGFSLRRITHCKNLIRSSRKKVFVKPLEIIRFYWNLGKFTEDFTRNPFRRMMIPLTIIAKSLGFNNTLGFYISNHVNEDLIFGSWSNASWGHKAYLPSVEEAMAFSFEVNPSLLYERNNKTLPFGCHAFEKWEYESFWKTFINI